MANAGHAYFAQFGHLLAIRAHGGNLQLDRCNLPTRCPLPPIAHPSITVSSLHLCIVFTSQLSTEPISLSAAQSQVQQSLQQRQLRAELTSSVLVISRVLRVQSFATIKGAVQLVEAFAKWMVEILHKCPVDLWDL